MNVAAAAGSAGVALAATAAALLVFEAIRAARGGVRAHPRLRLAVFGVLAGAVIAMGALEWAILTDDFSLEYVARNSARATPVAFKVATAWAALEGSIVLWGLVLAAMTALLWRTVRDGDRVGAAALAVAGAVAVFFFGLMATAANPFTVLDVVPADGPGPNPLLQNHAFMLIHPPLLYVGFVGWTVPFGLAIGALALGEGGCAWVERSRRWSLVAWTFLTAGIVFGAWWSYEVLGWGGYWAWDPVENASLLPWLTATAFIHSAVAQRRRGVLQAWNISLIVATFALTILGTFLTRSGVVSSVHSFTQSAVGPVLLAFLAVVLVASLALFAARAHLVASTPRLESIASREGAFLVNNLLLAVFTFVVLIGTTYPVLVEAASGAQLSVGRPFFDRFTVPIAFALLLTMGVGPLLPYRVAAGSLVRERLRIPVVAGLGAAAVLAFTAGVASVVVVGGFTAAVLAAVARQLSAAAARHPAGGHVAVVRVLRGNPGYWGGQLSHVGVALVAFAIALSGGLAERSTVTLTQGSSVDFAGFELHLDEIARWEEPHRSVVAARVDVSRGGTPTGMLEPRINEYRQRAQPIGTPSVRSTFAGDLYASVAAMGTDEVTLNLYRYPLQWMLWIGGVVVAAGGLWALAGGRRRRDPPPTATRVAEASQEVGTRV
ncbi:MAG: heme lyase CcmF/NrfE family subunit [Actinobacteria bacterium]|nr:heme lyase CcmF/NrfE family subunit [Actinomycetota bacterium]